FLTDVAAVGMPPEALALIDRDAALQLDRQVRQAARRVEDVRLDDRAGRTGVETEPARAALIQRRRVGLERQAADDLREKQPRSEVRIDDARVAPDPAEAGVLRVDALL